MFLAAILPASTSASTFALLNSTASSASLLVLLIASLAFSLKSAVMASARVFASSANFLTVSFMVLNPLVAAATGFGAALGGLDAIFFTAAFGGATFLAAALGAAAFFATGLAFAFTVLILAGATAGAAAGAAAWTGAAGVATGFTGVSSVAASKAFSALSILVAIETTPLCCSAQYRSDVAISRVFLCTAQNFSHCTPTVRIFVRYYRCLT